MSRLCPIRYVCRQWLATPLLVLIIVHASGCATPDPRVLVGVAIGVAAGAVIHDISQQHGNAQQEERPTRSESEPVRAIPATSYPISTIEPGVVSTNPQPWRELPPPPSGIRRKVLVMPAHSLYEQGLVAYQDGRYEDALTNFELFTRTDPIDTREKMQAFTYAAASAYLLNQPDKAVRLVRKLLEIQRNPNIDSSTFPPEFRLFVSQIRSTFR